MEVIGGCPPDLMPPDVAPDAPAPEPVLADAGDGPSDPEATNGAERDE